MTRDSAPDPDDRLQVAGLMWAGLGPLLVAALLVPFRGDAFVAANVTLVFVMVVVIAAATAGKAAGTTASVVSVMAYDFFLTRPYQSLKIDRLQDVVTVLLLLAIGLLVAELAGYAWRTRALASRRADALARVGRVSELVAAGAGAEKVQQAVEHELTELLSLRGCRFETTPYEELLPVIEPNGVLAGGRRRWVGRELSLPAEGAQLPVRGRGHEHGRLVLVPDWDVGVSVSGRVTAHALADQLGASLGSDPIDPQDSEREDSA